MSLGQQLRQERERRGVSLADIAKETRISVRHLEAIETGDTRTMPKDFFYRSFARQYANHLGMEPEAIAKALDLEIGATAPVTDLGAMAAAAGAAGSSRTSMTSILRPAEAPTPRISDAVRPTQESSATAMLQESRTSVPWLVLAGVLLVGSISFLAWERVRAMTPVETAAAPPKVSAPQPGEVREAVAPAALKPEDQQEESTVTTTTANGTVVEATKLASGSLKLIISAKEPAWIQLDADGKALFVGLLEAGQSQEVENAQQAKLLTGNAGGIEVLQNGKPVTGIGSRGEVRTVVFSQGDYQVLRPGLKPETSAAPAKPEGAQPDSGPVAE